MEQQKPTLIAIRAEALDELIDRMAQLETHLAIQLGAISKRLDEMENKISPPAYELEYAMIPTALKYTGYKETKIKQLARTYFKNGEAVIRTRKPNGGTRGVTYCIADLKEADLRAENWRREEQGLPMRKE